MSLDPEQWEFLFDAMGPYRNHIPYERWLPNHPFIAWRMAELALLNNEETVLVSVDSEDKDALEDEEWADFERYTFDDFMSKYWN